MKVTEMTVAVGVTRSAGTNYEFNRLDMTDRIVLDEPLEVGSAEYRKVHHEAAAALKKRVAITYRELFPPPEKD